MKARMSCTVIVVALMTSLCTSDAFASSNQRNWATAGKVLAGVAAGLGYEPATVAAMSAGAAVLFSGVAKVAAQGTEEKPDKVAKEEWDVQKYGDVKRALFALKKMKKALAPESTYKKEVQALYASGLGNPGGMITALNLKQGGR